MKRIVAFKIIGWILVCTWTGMFVLGFEYPLLFNIAINSVLFLGFCGLLLAIWVVLKAKERKLQITAQHILPICILAISLLFGLLYQFR